MNGYQFAHMEVYSVKGAPAGRAEGKSKKKNGQRIWTAAEILDEAERLELASLHVEKGRPAPEILPGDVDGFEALREAHTKASTVKEKAFTQVSKTGKTKTVRRRLRSDAASLYTCIISLPVLTEDALADPVERERCVGVLRAAMAHERERIEAARGRLMMGVIHWDEGHVHAHLYALDPQQGRVDHLHPGRAAKAAFVTKHATSGTDPKTVNRGGNAAYCDAMRAWQDDLHDDVFRDAGLLRLGPRAERLSRADYMAKKRAAAERGEDERRQTELRTGQKELKAGLVRLGEMMAEHEALVLDETAELARESEEIAERSRKVDDRTTAVDARETSAKALSDEAASEKKAAAKKGAEADAGLAVIEALAAGLIEVKQEGTEARVVAPAGADKHPMWAQLWARITPAMLAAIRVARQVEAGLRALRERARQEGLAQAKAEARAEMERTRTAMEAATEAAVRVVGIARAYAAKLAPADRAGMLAEIDAARHEEAKQRTTAHLAETSKPRRAEDRPRGHGDASGR